MWSGLGRVSFGAVTGAWEFWLELEPGRVGRAGVGIGIRVGETWS